MTVEVSLDGRNWEDCCDEDDKTHFYLDDKKDEINKVQSHSFGDLVAARYIRIKVSTSLRWVGHDDKCFRFELLGCSHVSQARGNMSAEATSHGYIAMSWSPPNVTLPLATELTLSSVTQYSVTQYSVVVTHEETGQVTVYNTTDHSVIHPNPVYDQTYSVRLTCFYHNLPINCGSQKLKARPFVSLSCLAHSSFCKDNERVVFRLPSKLTASYVGNGSALIEWVNNDLGWVSQYITITIKV